MPSYWGLVNMVIRDSDILLVVLDARIAEESRNFEIEDKVKASGKPLIYIFNKCDLVKKDYEQPKMKQYSIRVSAKEHLGISKLRERIHIEATRLGKKMVNVGVLGYPNVGKSSLINALKGRKAARTSALSGHTTNLQRVRVGKRIMLMDTPGVIPYDEKKEEYFVKHAAMGSIDFIHMREPDIVVAEFIMKFPGVIEKHYEIDPQDDPYDVIEEIAEKRRILKKGGIPDMVRMARMILTDWQKGKIKDVKAEL